MEAAYCPYLPKNKKMKKILVSFIAITSIMFSAKAQIQRNNNDVNKEYEKHQGKKDHKQMAKDLDLSNDQKQQMKSINMDFKNRMKDLKNSNLSESELKAKRETLQQERKQKMMFLLTPEQKNKFAEYKNNKHVAKKMVPEIK